MRQRLFDLLAIFSTMLCCAVVVLWVRSYWKLDVWVHDVGQHSYAFRTDPAAVCFRHITPPPRARPAWSHEVYPTNFATRLRPPISERRVLGFQWDAGTLTAAPMIQGVPPRMDYIAIVIPDWILLLCFGSVPAMRMSALRKRRARAPAGRCVRCGYDLRATPDRCPECGTIRAKTAAAT